MQTTWNEKKKKEREKRPAIKEWKNEKMNYTKWQAFID